jgi:hypothetical protein
MLQNGVVYITTWAMRCCRISLSVLRAEQLAQSVRNGIVAIRLIAVTRAIAPNAFVVLVESGHTGIATSSSRKATSASAGLDNGSGSREFIGKAHQQSPKKIK